MQSYHVTVQDSEGVVFDDYFDTLVEASYEAEKQSFVGDLVQVHLCNDCLDGYEDEDIIIMYRKRD